MERLGFKVAAKILSEAMPQTPKGRSGDLGEILATELVEEEIGLRVPVRRLRYKDGRNMAMRGDDFIGAGYDAAGDPRAFVKDFTATSTVPGDVRPWLLRRAPTRQAEAFAIWRRAAASRLLMALANQVSEAATAIVYHFSGPPTRAVKIPPAELDPLFERLTQGAAWVYRDGRDAEARHLLLSNEFGRTWKEAEPKRFGSGALESTMSVYRSPTPDGSVSSSRRSSQILCA